MITNKELALIKETYGLSLNKKVLAKLINKVVYKNAIIRNEAFDNNVKYLLEDDKLAHLLLKARIDTLPNKKFEDSYWIEKLAEKIVTKVLTGEWRK